MCMPPHPQHRTLTFTLLILFKRRKSSCGKPQEACCPPITCSHQGSRAGGGERWGGVLQSWPGEGEGEGAPLSLLGVGRGTPVHTWRWGRRYPSPVQGRGRGYHSPGHGQGMGYSNPDQGTPERTWSYPLPPPNKLKI